MELDCGGGGMQVFQESSPHEPDIRASHSDLTRPYMKNHISHISISSKWVCHPQDLMVIHGDGGSTVQLTRIQPEYVQSYLGDIESVNAMAGWPCCELGDVA